MCFKVQLLTVSVHGAVQAVFIRYRPCNRHGHAVGVSVPATERYAPPWY